VKGKPLIANRKSLERAATEQPNAIVINRPHPWQRLKLESFVNLNIVAYYRGSMACTMRTRNETICTHKVQNCINYFILFVVVHDEGVKKIPKNV